MRWMALGAACLLAGCVAQSGFAPEGWYDTAQGIVPTEANRVFVCHGFGCHYRSAVTFSRADIRTMRRIVGRPRTAKEERRRLRKLVAWAEKRVAPTAGSADDVGGLDLGNSRKRGQMDCIDEATNTTSYLLVAAQNGILRHHEVASPVARGFFLDGRYPHATAVVSANGEPYAIDSWPMANGELPNVMPLETWFASSAAA
ncbi:MAG: hypothetical protein AAGJ94_00945 [Pseudomonadota bacterium]